MFSSHDAAKLHKQLIAELMGGFLNDPIAIINWKDQFRKHCSDTTIAGERIYDHFKYLEKEGLIKIGKYDVLRKIFTYINDRAVHFIDIQSEKIQKHLVI